MLVLTVKIGEKVVIADNITVTVVDDRHNRVRLGFDAPKDVPIDRWKIREEKSVNDKRKAV